MPIFIKLKEEDRINLFKIIKNKIKYSWEKFYPKLKISRGSFFNYLSGRYDIPEEILIKLQDTARIKLQIMKITEKPRYLEKQIKKFNLDNKLAEIFGILNGDGHISKSNYEICVVGNSLEKEYYTYLKNLFESKFRTSFTFIIDKSSFKLKVYSKHLSNILVGEYGLPKGNKMGQLRIPKQVISSDYLLKSYLRGLFDTDGCFHIRRKKDPMIGITSADPRFLEEIKSAFTYLGFKVAKGADRMFIYHKSDIARFFKEIKPANSKHLKKYQNFQDLKRG